MQLNGTSLESLDGCPGKTAEPTSKEAVAMYATATRTTITAAELKDKGLQSVQDLLMESDFAFKPVKDGYEVATEYGPRTVPAIIPFEQRSSLVASLKQPEPEPQPKAAAPEVKPDKTGTIVGWGVLGTLAALLFYTPSNPKPALAGLPKKRIAYYKL